jgi:peroxiredoxin
MKRYNAAITSVALVALSALNLTACAEGKKDEGEKSAKTGVVEQQSGSIKAADFTLTDLAGKPLKLSEFQGKVVILDFWATWCGPCVKEIPHFNELSAEYGDTGLVILGISVDRDGKPAVNKFKEKSPINYRVAVGDKDLYNIYQQYLPPDERGGIPFTFIIDKQGVIRQHFVGYRPKEVFVETIKPLL